MLAVLGDLVEDVVVWVDGPIRHGADSAARIVRTRGGSGANVAALAAATTPTRFLGCVGEDTLGDLLTAELERSGVEVRLQRRGRTGSVVVLVDDTGERSMFPDRAAAALLESPPEAWLDGARLLHVTAYTFGAEPAAASAVALLHACRSRGVAISIDASSTGLIEEYGTERFVTLLADLAPDLLFANSAEAELLGLTTDGGPAKDGRLSGTTVVAKSGPEPTTVLRTGAESLTVPVPPVADVRDSTGAGDAFAAAFLALLLRAPDLRRALTDDAVLRAACEAGHTGAARVLRAPGATHFDDHGAHPGSTRQTGSTTTS